VLNALEESNVIYFIVSSRDGVIGLDREIAIQLRKLKKDIVSTFGRPTREITGIAKDA
jgi:GTP-binding protein